LAECQTASPRRIKVPSGESARLEYTLAENVHADAAPRHAPGTHTPGVERRSSQDRFVGFSAGGEVAGMIETKFDAGKSDAERSIERVSSRPDFSVLGVPVVSPRRKGVRDTPLFPIRKDAPLCS